MENRTENKLGIITHRGCQYKIMCPADERIWGKMFRFKEKQYYRGLCERIKAFFTDIGCEIEIVPYAPTTPEDKVIIVGPTYEVCDRMLMKDVRPHQYIVKASGNRIVLGAWLDYQLRLAVERLIELFRENWDGWVNFREGLYIDPPNEVLSMPIRTEVSPRPNVYKDRFVYTYYGGPRAEIIDENMIKMIADLKMNRLMFGLESRENILKVAELARKYGMDITIRPSEAPMIGSLIYGTCAEVTDEALEAEVQNVIDTYGDIPEIVEWYICDEPPRRNCVGLARVMKMFQKLDPSRPLNVNHFYGNGEAYYHHLESYLDKAEYDMISFDRYELVGYDPELNGNEYYDSMLVVTDFATRYNITPGMINQLSTYRVFDLYRSNMYEEQIRWEDNLCLAYGFKFLSKFTLFNMRVCEQVPDIFDGGAFDLEWKPTKTYHALKAVAPKITAHGNLLLPKKFEMVYHLNTGETLGAPKYIPFGGLGELKGENAVIGFFDDGTFILTNNIFKTGAPMNTITICEHYGSNLEWYDTSDETWKDARECENVEFTFDGYKVSLLPGDAEVFRVVK